MKLSIIIPVYRTQDTLQRCMESILQQSFTDYELILVDDGSPDDCPILCDEWAKKYNSISVIHKANGGLSDARNAGIMQAKGEYITFVDSDDAIDKDTLQALMNELIAHPDIDIIEYPVMERIGHPTKERLLTFVAKDYDNAVDYWLNEQAYLHTYACNKIFRRSLFDKVSFPKGKTFEDVLTIPYLIGLIPTEPGTARKVKIRVTNVGCYQYYWNDYGITANARYADLLCLHNGQSLALANTFSKIENKEETLKRYQHSINIYLTQTLNVLLDLYELSGKYEDCPYLIKYARIMKSKGLVTSLKLKLLLTIGYERLCTLNRLIHKIHRRR